MKRLNNNIKKVLGIPQPWRWYEKGLAGLKIASQPTVFTPLEAPQFGSRAHTGHAVFTHLPHFRIRPPLLPFHLSSVEVEGWIQQNFKRN
jgi:hypothetical protein